MLIDRQLAAQLEAADAHNLRHYTTAVGQIVPASNATTALIGDAAACYTGPDLPINRAVGAGSQQQWDAKLFGKLAAFYHQRQLPVSLELTPFCDPSLQALLALGNYRISRWWSVLAFDMLRYTPFSLSSVQSRIIAAEQRHLWVEAMTERGQSSPMGITMANAAAARSDSQLFGAWLDDELIGCGALSINAEVATLFSTFVSPAWRRRGAQTSLIAARLAHAQAQGCRWATVLTISGSDSQRIVTRAGFKLAYNKVTLEEQRGS
ncbi:GNAT family N-acetyltransferase [Herpetosiphon llansteffanensis]|uniref:GNAT family N-acetyltransferase n=1 Tax=Herpetosiphon llansteffanensis TaxID=2094568 RepID=UPI0013DF7D06|nr:GNAT family N-acetyltransferase [Herpetosiphon llansteffanensis]